MLCAKNVGAANEYGEIFTSIPQSQPHLKLVSTSSIDAVIYTCVCSGFPLVLHETRAQWRWALSYFPTRAPPAWVRDSTGGGQKCWKFLADLQSVQLSHRRPDGDPHVQPEQSAHLCHRGISRRLHRVRCGQAGAVRHAVARALVRVNPEWKSTL